MNELAQKISDVFFEVDPANTCCKENDCFDEYDTFSVWVESDLDRGLKTAIESSYEDYFGQPISSENLEKLLEKLKDIE
jgi:hypothetical protein